MPIFTFGTIIPPVKHCHFWKHRLFVKQMILCGVLTFLTTFIFEDAERASFATWAQINQYLLSSLLSRLHINRHLNSFLTVTTKCHTTWLQQSCLLQNWAAAGCSSSCIIFGIHFKDKVTISHKRYSIQDILQGIGAYMETPLNSIFISEQFSTIHSQARSTITTAAHSNAFSTSTVTHQLWKIQSHANLLDGNRLK